MVERLADNYQQIYSNSDIKPFNSLSAEFSNLPLEVLQIVKMPLEQHSPLTQKILLKYDPLLINDSAIDINNNLDNDTSPDSDISSKNLSENSHISTKAQNQTNAANNSAASSEIRNNITQKTNGPTLIDDSNKDYDSSSEEEEIDVDEPVDLNGDNLEDNSNDMTLRSGKRVTFKN